MRFDDREQKLRYKIREDQVAKIPYILVLGDKEVKSNSVNVRKHGEVKCGSFDLTSFIEKI
ncbi:His/Gly/Thr/Pro-type tRNA ligase C-terminal domain-containing protein [Priestia aryabhattai]|uniref:His/Gly/Thr/Pro-type tRNA ligase C-terminal domain-containing protein n=1 Tax=Priestia aryabhattai TaxID=412384 RepID=UPI00398335C3